MPSDIHAILGASSSARWIACPGSVNAIAALPEGERDRGSSYAREGTAAHFLAERCLRHGERPEDYAGQWISDFGAIIEDEAGPGAGDKRSEDWFEVSVEMVDAVQLYLDTIFSHLERLGNAELFIEVRVQPIPGRDDLFGTADCVIYEPGGELVVIDFKYGVGIVVEVAWNDQAMYYGLGALHEIGGADDVSKVTLVVVQPRARHREGPVRPWECTPQQLLDFGDTIASAADATRDPNAPLVPGEHCQNHFCPAAARCTAINSMMTDNMREALPDDLSEPDTVELRLPDPNDPKELRQAKAIADLARFWGKKVDEMLHDALERGVEGTGFKLVEGRSNRRWKSDEDVERRLRNKAEVHVEDVYTRKVVSPAQAEKMLKKVLGDKKKADAWVARHCEKPPGKKTVAPEHDKRDTLPRMIEALTEIND